MATSSGQQSAGSASRGGDGSGRVRQRRRTRSAIVSAAAELIRAGGEPSAGDIAEAADVSRRTVYQYFPTVDQLLIDATLGMLSEAPVEAAIDEAGAEAGDATERVAAMIRALAGMSAETLALGRSLIRLTVGSASPDSDQPRRGYRRIAWIERALEPLRPELEPAAYERLVSALAMVIGWEALIVLGDLRALPPDEQTEVSVWAAKSLIQATLDEARISPR